MKKILNFLAVTILIATTIFTVSCGTKMETPYNIEPFIYEFFITNTPFILIGVGGGLAFIFSIPSVIYWIKMQNCEGCGIGKRLYQKYLIFISITFLGLLLIFIGMIWLPFCPIKKVAISSKWISLVRKEFLNNGIILPANVNDWLTFGFDCPTELLNLWDQVIEVIGSGLSIK